MKGDVSMAKRENYNELYLFMQVVREGSFTAALSGWVLLSQESAVLFASLKKGWVSSC